jgi:hypothetical protein
MKTMRALLTILAAAATVQGALAPASADEKTERRRAELLAQMRSLAQQTTVTYESGAGQPTLAEHPVFRYDDQPRRFIDATIWAWTDGGRPVAFQKVEASFNGNTDEARWGYCFASLAENRLAVQWEHGKSFRTTQAGVAFVPLPGAPAVAARGTARKRQARDLSREFSARILLDPRSNSTEAMRLLTTPIYEYDSAQGEYRGAAFGYSTSGRNPDLLILIEAREADGKLAWHYAPVRMTIGGVTIKLHDKTVWDVPFIEPRPQDLPTWTFFYQPRQPIESELPPAP